MEAIDVTDYDYVLPEDKKAVAKYEAMRKAKALNKDQKKPAPTIWIISTLTFEQDTHIENEVSRKTPDGDIAAMVLHMGLKNVRDFNLKGKPVAGKRIKEDEDNSHLKLPGDVMPWTNEFMSTIPIMARNQLQLQIRFGKEISETERKNS